MPGLSFVANQNGISAQEKALILQSFASILYADNYKTKIYGDEPCYILGTTAYNEYPTWVYNDEEFLIFQEGEIFGLDESAMKLTLYSLASSIFKKSNQAQNNVPNLLETLDGDFIILIVSKALNSIILLNDTLGRLPIYYYHTKKTVIISRDLSFISSIAPEKKIDRMSVAQYLLLGYPLGERTLIEGIFRLQPATFIRINFTDFSISMTKYYEFNFENKYYQHNSVSHNVKQLTSLFSQACQRRHNKDRYNILGLSGGLDSRSVAACLSQNNIPFIGVTRLTDERKSKLDAKYAREVSKTLNCDWNLVYTNPPKGSDVLKLLRIKNGSNYLAMSSVIPFLEKAQQIYGTAITYWTGDGGDKIIPDIRPSRKLANVSDIIDYVIADQGILSLKHTANLIQLKMTEILEEIEGRIISYPEKKWTQKYIHFIIFERAFKFLFEGEDRNRCYFWSVTPFFSHAFLNFAMNLPDEQKSKYTLYQRFLEELSPEISGIDDPNHKLPNFSGRASIKSLRNHMIRITPIGLRKTIKRYYARRSGTIYHDLIMNQIDKCESIREYLSLDIMKALIPHLSMLEVQTLLTVTAVIELIETRESSIANYNNSQIS